MQTQLCSAALATLISMSLVTAPRAAQAAHPSLEACGGLSANRDEGVRDSRFLSRRQERLIEDFLKKADATPGVAIAIAKGDRLIYARGFGFRDLSTCEKTRSDTRFYLKSTTKHFLGAAAAVLQEEGAIELDAPISDYLPELRFPDGLQLEQTSIRSHLIHTQPYFDSGVNYRTAFPGNLAEEDLIEHVNEYSEPRNIRFRYSNFGPIIAAHAIGEKTGLNWRDFIREKIFEPAGMTDSFTSMAQAEQGPMATGYIGAENTDFELTLTKVDSQMHAAGGTISTAADMGRWLILNLNHGRIDGAQAIPRRAIEQAQARQVQLQAEFLDYKRFAYGLGLYSADYEGELLLHHFGGETHMSFMPERDLGVVVLSNEMAFGVHLTHALASTIYDMLLEKPDLTERIDRRLEAIAADKTRFVERLEKYMARIRERAPKEAPVFSEPDIVGDYVNPRLGEMSLISSAGALKVVYGAQSGPATHMGGDAYLADFTLWKSLPPSLFVFRQGEECPGLVLDWDGRIFCKRPH